MSNREIAEIKETLAALARRVDALEAGHPPISAQPRAPEPQTTMKYPAPPATVTPSEQELRQLLELVWSGYPMLKPPDGQLETYSAEFRNSLAYLSQTRRSETPNTGCAASYWMSAVPGGTTLLPFVAAAVVSDVPYAPLTRFRTTSPSA